MDQNDVSTMNAAGGRGRGFAGMDPKRQREIASKGGKSVPAAERSFSRNHELAAAAGRKGGKSVPATERSFSRNHSLAVEAGRKGGRSRSATTPTPDNDNEDKPKERAAH